VSRIYFDDRNGQVELRGAERAHMAMKCKYFALSFLLPVMDYDNHPSMLRQLLGGKKDFPRSLEKYLEVFVGGYSDGVFHVGKRRINSFAVMLNTSMLLGNHIVQLFARVHGQCEIHGWFAGEDRWRLAKTIEEGRGLNLMRADMGWEDVHDFLLRDDKEPVVMSYSVCDEFPHAPSSWYDEHDGNEWYDLSGEERWNIAFAALEKQPSLRIRYENGRWDYDAEDQLFFIDSVENDPWVFTTADINAIADQLQEQWAAEKEQACRTK
jgi:hypothetical protein